MGKQWENEWERMGGKCITCTLKLYFSFFFLSYVVYAMSVFINMFSVYICVYTYTYINCLSSSFYHTVSSIRNIILHCVNCWQCVLSSVVHMHLWIEDVDSVERNEKIKLKMNNNCCAVLFFSQLPGRNFTICLFVCLSVVCTRDIQKLKINHVSIVLVACDDCCCCCKYICFTN